MLQAAMFLGWYVMTGGSLSAALRLLPVMVANKSPFCSVSAQRRALLINLSQGDTRLLQKMPPWFWL